MVIHSSPADYVCQSTLMSKLTGTHSEVSEIDFTTLTTVPGTLKIHGAPIQILDLRMFNFDLSRVSQTSHSAGIIEGAAEGRGRGKQGNYQHTIFFPDLLTVRLQLLQVRIPTPDTITTTKTSTPSRTDLSPHLHRSRCS